MKRGAALLVVLALGAFQVLSSPVQAQAGGNPQYQVQITGDPAKDTIRKSHGSTVFEFTVSFRCQPLGQTSPGPCTGTNGNTVSQVSVRSTKTVPDGWSIELDSSTFSMQVDETRVIEVAVQLEDDEPARDSFPIELKVASTVTIGVPPLATTDSSEAVDSVRVDKILDTAEQVTNWLKQYALPIGGVAAVLLLAAFVLRNRKSKGGGGIHLQTDTQSQELLPGRGASFAIAIVNDSSDEDRVHLGTGPLPQGWVSIVPLSEIDLRPGERSQLWLTVRAPPRVTPGELVNFSFRARSIRHSGREAGLELSVLVSEPAPSAVTFPPAAPTAPPAPAIAIEPFEPMEPAPAPMAAKRRKTKRR